MSVRLNKAPGEVPVGKAAATSVSQPGPATTPSANTPSAGPAANARPIYFVPGADQITAEGKRVLQTLGARGKENRRITFTLVGHTDDTGSTEFDIAHAQRRVDLVATELQRQGVGARQIRRISHGSEAILPARCADETCKALLRRVDLIMEE